MADKNLNIKLSVKGQQQAQRRLGSVEQSIGKMAKTVGGAVTAFVAIERVIAGVAKSIEDFGRFEAVSTGFENLASSSGFSADALDKFTKATDGTVSSIELMQQANNAMLLGIAENEDQMANMFDVAQRLASALGQDTRFGVESLVTGLGRQSKMMLDNLGIMIDVDVANKNFADSINKTVKELTDQERKQAFVNEAMKSANELVANLGEEQLNTRDTVAQLSVSMETLSIAIGEKLSPITRSVTGLLASMADSMTSMITLGDEVSGTFVGIVDDSAQSKIDAFANSIKGLSKEELVELQNELARNNQFIQETSTNYGHYQKQVALVQTALSAMLIEEQKQAELTQFVNENTLPKTIELRRSENEIIDKNQESYEKFLATSRERAEEQEMESKNIQRLIDQYPQLAESLGYLETKTKSSSDNFKVFNENLDTAIASAIASAGAINSTSDALFASEKAAKQATISFVSGEVQKAVAFYISKFLATTPLPPIISAPLAIAGGAAFGSLMSSTIARNFAEGGIVPGQGNTDSVPAMLTPGEVILNQAQQENLTGNMGNNITLNISAPLVDDTVVDTIIPAIQSALSDNRATLET